MARTKLTKLDPGSLAIIVDGELVYVNTAKYLTASLLMQFWDDPTTVVIVVHPDTKIGNIRGIFRLMDRIAEGLLNGKPRTTSYSLRIGASVEAQLSVLSYDGPGKSFL